MRKIKLVVEYDGSAYCGWQYQPNGLSIQEVFEGALLKITKVKTNVVASGRTDSGVHAEGQVVHFLTASKMTERQFLKALNSVLPPDIAVLSVEEVPKEFNARASATGKIYRYTILNRDFPSALQRGRAWYIPFKLNAAGMKRAARHLIGLHDFSAFRAANCAAKSPMRRMIRIDFKKNGGFLHLTFEGSGFLKHMIRNIVGTLVEVGKGRMTVKQVREILESRDRGKAGPTAPAYGLCLVRVFYDTPDK